MIPKRWLGLCLLLLVSGCCARSERETEHDPFVRDMSAARAASSDPGRDFTRFLASGQPPFFYGVHGLSLTVPGAMDYYEVRAPDVELVVIEGTSDTMPSELSIRVRNYATAFNTLMVWHLDRWGLNRYLAEEQWQNE